jgi:hypothetical protein
MFYFIKRLTLTKDENGEKEAKSPAVEMRERIIKRAALEFKDHMFGILDNQKNDQ